MNQDLQKIRSIADYQFGFGAGDVIFSKNIRIQYSKKTGRIRHVYSNDLLYANYRPNDAFFTLTIAGATQLVAGLPNLSYKVTVLDDVVDVISEGKNVMAKHVLDAGDNIRSGDEVIVVDKGNNVIAIGKAILTKEEMLSYETGVAVKTRRGREKDR
jgi:7-cyano-7-deazaguanine tRNA-ribosyltransferase